MRVRTSAGAPRRGGAAVVEAAITFGLYFFLLFSVFEFTRYIYLVQIAASAARDGARLAACNISNPHADWDGVAGVNDAFYGANNPYFEVPAVKARVLSHMSGAEQSLRPRDSSSGTTGGTMPIIQVFPIDSGTAENPTIYADPPVFRPRLQTESPAWNNARFPEKLAVRVTGQYTPIMPLYTPPSGASVRVYDVTRIDIVVVTNSEG